MAAEVESATESSSSADQDLSDVLHRAITSSNSKSVADSLACAVRHFRQCRLRAAGFRDDFWTPALEFLAIMGWGPAKVFRGIFGVFCGALADHLDCGQRRVLEQILPEMLGHRKSPGVFYLLAVALERLGCLPKPSYAMSSSVEDDVFSILADLPEADSNKLPHSLRQRLLARDLPAFYAKVQPLLDRALEWLRYNIGPFMLLQGTQAIVTGNSSELRSGFDAISDLADLVGHSYELFEATSSFIRAKTNEAIASEEPIFRRSPLKDESRGAPVSVGHEPFLNTIRSQLLLTLVDRQILTPSISGTWAIRSEWKGKTYNYNLRIAQHGDTFSGTSTLRGNYNVKGRIRLAKQPDAPGSTYLAFQQAGTPTGKQIIYVCSCYVTDDLQELISGKFQQKDSTSQGTFVGWRVGNPCYADRHGRSWDPSIHFVMLCDSMHRSPAALDDSLRQLITKAAGNAQGQLAFDGRELSQPTLESILSDTLVVQSLLRGFMFSRNSQNDPLHGSLDDKERLSLLLLLRLTAVEQLSTPFSKSLLEQVREGPPSEEYLNQAGLSCEHLVKSLRYFYEASTTTETEGAASSVQQQTAFHLDAALRLASSDLPRCMAAFKVMRLVCNFMVNFAILERKPPLLKEVLVVVTEVIDKTLPEASRPDWITRQLVDVLVNSGVHLGKLFDADLRSIVLEYLIPLAKVDAWVHFRVAEMLKIAFTTGISMAREQLRVCEELLEKGKREDSHYDWTVRLAMAYASIFKVRIHLQNHFETLPLGKAALEYMASVPDVQDVQQSLTEVKGAGVEGDVAPVHPSSNASEANFGAETVAGSVASSTFAASGEEEPWADSTPASNLSSPKNAMRKLRLRQWAQAILETQDGVLAPSIEMAIRVFCGDNLGDEGDSATKASATKAAELLQANFIGSHSLCYDAARWYIMLQQSAKEDRLEVGEEGDEGRNDKSSQNLEEFGDVHQLLKKSLLDTMEEAFDMKKADSVWQKRDEEGTLGKFDSLKDFCGAFIRVPEFRQLIYKLCAPMQAQASDFLSYMLFRITKSTSVRDGLREVMSRNVFAMHRTVFDFALQDKIRSFFQVAVEAGHPIGPSRISDYALGPALDELCKVCNFSEATYFYSQALLAGLAAARKSSRHIFRYISEAVSRTMPLKKSQTGVWLSDMRFRGLGRHRELFEILAAMYSTQANYANADSSHSFSRPRLALTTCAHPAQRLHCDISSRTVKYIAKSLEDLLCPEAKELWHRVVAEANSSAQDTLCDPTGFWQSSAFFKPLATKAVMEWTFPLLDAKDRERIAQECGWVVEPPEVVDTSQPVVASWTPGRLDASSADEDDHHHRNEAADHDSDGARTEAASDDDWGELDKGFEEAVLAAEISGGDWDAGRSEEGRSHASSNQRQVARTLCAQGSDASQVPSSFTESGYKMHAVSSRSMGSGSTNELPVRAGQDFEEIGAQSVLEFFRNPSFLEALVRAFLKTGHKKATRGCFVKLLALITTDGLLEEESCKEEVHKSVFLAQMAIRELLAINRLSHLESEHRRGIGSAWNFRLWSIMHFQSTAIASFAGLVWLREDFLAEARPYNELLGRLSSHLPFVFLQSALQMHPQQGEEVLVVLMHMLHLLLRNLDPEDAGIHVEPHSPDDSQNWMEDVNVSTNWEKKEAELEEGREKVRCRIASMLVYLIAAHQLALPVLDFLEESLSALHPRALKVFVVEMLSKISLPASERVMWAIARCLARSEVCSLLEGDGSADICAAIGHFCTAYDESPLRGQALSEEGVLNRVRCETDEKVKQLRTKLRDVLDKKSSLPGTPMPATPAQVPVTGPAAAKENNLWKWFWTSGKNRFAKMSRSSKKYSPLGKARPAKKNTNLRRRATKSSSSGEEVEDDDAVEDDDDEENEYDFETYVYPQNRVSSVGSRRRESTGEGNRMGVQVGRKRSVARKVSSKIKASRKFAARFHGRWAIHLEGRLIGHAVVDRSSSSCCWEALEPRGNRREVDIRGQGTEVDPFVFQPGTSKEAHLIKDEFDRLTWDIGSGRRTSWTREAPGSSSPATRTREAPSPSSLPTRAREACSPSSPPTPTALLAPSEAPTYPSPSPVRRSETPERSVVGVESFVTAMDDNTVVSQSLTLHECEAETSQYSESLGGGTCVRSGAEGQSQSAAPPKRRRLTVKP